MKKKNKKQTTPTKQDLCTSWYPHPFHMRAVPSPLDSCILLVLLFSHNLVPRAFSATIFKMADRRSAILKMVEEKALGTRLVFPCCIGKFFKANNFSTTEDTIQLSPSSETQGQLEGAGKKLGRRKVKNEEKSPWRQSFNGLVPKRQSSSGF